MGYKLIIKSGHASGKDIAIEEGQRIIIGRSDECSFTIANGTISRKHCAIIYQKNILEIQDLKSGNGTQVNGHPIKTKTLKAKDIITIGAIKLEVCYSKKEPLLEPTILLPEMTKVVHSKNFSEETFSGDLSQEKLKRDLVILHKIGKQVHSDQKLEDMLGNILETMLTHLHIEKGCFIIIPGNGKPPFSIFRILNKDNVSFSQEPFDICQNTLNTAVNDSIGTISSTDEDEDDYFPVSFEKTEKLCTYICGSKKNIGAIYLDGPIVTSFDKGDLNLVTAISRQVGLAIQQKWGEEAIQLANQKLEKASQNKSDFLASMSHELRTPLNAIIGYSELLLEEAKDTGQEDLKLDLNKIYSAGKHLLALISDILDLSKIEAGKIELHLEDFAVKSMINDVIATSQSLIQKKANKLVVNIAEDINNMYADQTKIRQALFNLISNAAKYTEQGTIFLKVNRRLSAISTTNWIIFEIRDTGIGMSFEQAQKIFEPFVQAESSTSSKYGGTGLGLAITKEFCKMMGGNVTVASKQGEGTTFTIVLPEKVAPN